MQQHDLPTIPADAPSTPTPTASTSSEPRLISRFTEHPIVKQTTTPVASGLPMGPSVSAVPKGLPVPKGLAVPTGLPVHTGLPVPTNPPVPPPPIVNPTTMAAGPVPVPIDIDLTIPPLPPLRLIRGPEPAPRRTSRTPPPSIKSTSASSKSSTSPLTILLTDPRTLLPSRSDTTQLATTVATTVALYGVTLASLCLLFWGSFALTLYDDARRRVAASSVWRGIEQRWREIDWEALLTSVEQLNNGTAAPGGAPYTRANWGQKAGYQTPNTGSGWFHNVLNKASAYMANAAPPSHHHTHQQQPSAHPPQQPRASSPAPNQPRASSPFVNAAPHPHPHPHRNSGGEWAKTMPSGGVGVGGRAGPWPGTEWDDLD
ncbi:hypothetical protein BC938DRAFT_475754 [Jimgerdemannia flammicorona]|uniref:Uncharacterized protein n=1 Tax=Jimgerdemannia flammicorona TaxID=994334 RepID=A0A433PPE7_9FUNG|nr:hypothetical protein BC938DRAFT_475754 [Jimgerdemannia flammicorona]